jgi:hypothetical protein
MKTINTKRFEVGIHDKVEGVIRTGWFEHNELGDEYGGTLWFEDDGTLYDYDGVYMVPLEVLTALKAEGFNVERMEDDHVNNELS